ncbi:MAG: tetratricopeptide repeat protein [Actinomycetota bacterium]
MGEIRRAAKPGRADEAIADLERATVLLERGDPRAAAREADKAKRSAPRAGVVREVLGLAHYGEEQWHEALTELQAYRRLSGRQDQNHVIADCQRALGHPEKAVALVTEALRDRELGIEVKAEAIVVGASALADQGRYDEALAMLRRAKTDAEVGRGPALRVWYVTGSVLEQAGRLDEALTEFRKVARHDAGAFDVLERVARLEAAGARSGPPRGQGRGSRSRTKARGGRDRG